MVNQTVEFQGDVFMLGQFNTIGGTTVQGVVRWNGLMWVPVGENPFKSCLAGVVYDDGSGPALYCAGRLNASQGHPAAVLRWSGSEWSNVGGVLSWGFSTLAVLDLGKGPTLYAGGTQDNAEDGSPVGCVAAWNGTAWQPVGDGFFGTSLGTSSVLALAAHDDGTGRRLYAGGIMLKNAAGELVNNVAVLVDGQWQPVGGGVSFGDPSTQVSALLSVPDDASGEPSLYAGGIFSYAGSGTDTQVRSLARWSGGSWHAVPIPGTGGYTVVRSIVRMAPTPGAPARLYVMGVLNSLTGLFMAYQEGGTWFEHPGRVPSTSGIEGQMWSAMAVAQPEGGTRMVGCGSFSRIDGTWMNSITIWDGSRWLPFGEGLNAAILTSVVFDDGQGGGPALYVGGIANAGLGETFGYVAKWTGSGWQKLGLGLNGTVSSLAVYDSGNGPRLVAAGSFTKTGTTTVGSVAQWDGAQWSKLGSAAAPITNSYGLVSFAGQPGSGTTSLYAMGNVSTQYKLARFDGTSWQVVSELTATSLGQAVVWNDGTGPALWIGGFAMKINGVTVGSLAKFDGTNWSWPAQQPLGAVWAMTVLQQPEQSSSQLVLGGGILLSGPTQASRVVSFDGASWTPFQDGFDSDCAALTTIYSPAFNQNVVVAGGPFTTSNGMPVNSVATYTGAEWRPLGGGTSGKFPTGGVTGVAMLRAVPASVVAPGQPGETLLVGGGFTQTPSGDAGLARWNMCACPADLNHDGQVDGTDMGMLLSAWGPCQGCDADLNGDGQVNGTDLGMLLGEWTG